jgi:hypothetical protein
MQPSDQVVGQFASSKMEVDEGYVRSMLGEKALGLSRIRGWPGHGRSQELKQALDGFADTPGILDQEDIQALQIIR